MQQVRHTRAMIESIPFDQITVMAEPVALNNTTSILLQVDNEVIPLSDAVIQAQPASMSDLRRDDVLRLLLICICVLIGVFIIMFVYQLVNSLYIQPKWFNDIFASLDRLEKK